MDVIVNYADVLHEGIHTCGPHEAIPLILQLLGERIRLWRRLGDVRQGPRCTLLRGLVGLRQRCKARTPDADSTDWVGVVVVKTPAEVVVMVAMDLLLCDESVSAGPGRG
jgi:hypothetical protein